MATGSLNWTLPMRGRKTTPNSPEVVALTVSYEGGCLSTGLVDSLTGVASARRWAWPAAGGTALLRRTHTHKGTGNSNGSLGTW